MIKLVSPNWTRVVLVNQLAGILGDVVMLVLISQNVKGPTLAGCVSRLT